MLAAKKRLYEKRKALGLCHSCGQPRNGASNTMCKACLEKLRIRSTRYRELNANRIKEVAHAYSKRVHLEALEKIAFDKKIPLRCPCGCSEIDFLEIDHINNDGNAERESIGGQVFCRAIRDGERTTKDLTILCRACNFIKLLNLKIKKGQWKISFS